METLQKCMMCKKAVISLDYEAQLYFQSSQYYTVKLTNEDETWETCNPNNEFVTYCDVCFAPKLHECKKRIIGNRITL